MEIDIGEIILEEELNIGEIELDVIKQYPELESLEVTPTSQEQTFKSDKYGYSNVKVKAIESEELNIVPSSEEQINEGIFNKVTVQGDNNLIAENVKEGTEIFGVAGTAKVTNAKITDASYLFYLEVRIDYLNELLVLCQNVTNTSRMFYACINLKSLDLSNFDTSKVTNMSYMFYSCNNLASLDLSNFDTSKVKDMTYMFSACSGLSSLDLSNFDASKIIVVGYMFSNCNSLTDFKCFKNLGKGYTSKSNNYSNYKLDLSYCPLLTHESLMSVINNLYDLNLTYNVANGGRLYAQTLNLGSTNKSKLTEEEIAIATNKGWNVT